MTATKRLELEIDALAIDDELAAELARRAECRRCSPERLPALALSDRAAATVRRLLAETGAGDLVEPEDVEAWLLAQWG